MCTELSKKRTCFWSQTFLLFLSTHTSLNHSAIITSFFLRNLFRWFGIYFVISLIMYHVRIGEQCWSFSHLCFHAVFESTSSYLFHSFLLQMYHTLSLSHKFKFIKSIYKEYIQLPKLMELNSGYMYILLYVNCTINKKVLCLQIPNIFKESLSTSWFLYSSLLPTISSWYSCYTKTVLVAKRMSKAIIFSVLKF